LVSFDHLDEFLESLFIPGHLRVQSCD
jgi:hypothetical protein